METKRSVKGCWTFGKSASVHAWTSGDNREKEAVYFWADWMGTVKGLEYRVVKDGKNGEEVVGWTKMVTSPKVFKKTGFVDDDPGKGPDPVGGAEMLAAGTYALELRGKVGATEYVMKGIRFEVAKKGAEKGGWQLGV